MALETNPAFSSIFNYASTYPTSGTWAQGALIINNQPYAGQPLGWICVAGGSTGGTWAALPAAAALTVGNVTAAGVLSSGLVFATISNTAAATYTLAPAASYAPGALIQFLNTGGGASTIVASSTNTLVGAAAITLSTGVLNFRSDGNTTWYKV